jgi:hypothetical protein
MSADKEDPKITALRKRIQREHDEIISGVGLVTRVWATLEMSLFELFRLLARLAIPSPGPEIAGVIFYTPSNTETRISLVNNLITYHCQLQRIGDIDDRLVKLWSTKIKGKIDNLKNTRNAIVHGAIVLSARGMDQRQRLAPTFGDTLRFQPTIHQHPGLGPSDLSTHEKAVWRVTERTQKLTLAFAHRMQARFGPDNEAAIRALLELVHQLETDWSSQNNQDQEQPDETDPSQSSDP